LDILASNTELREKMGRNNLTAIKRFGIETVLSEMRKIYDAEVSDC
jgi:hypothetical protein